MKTLIAFGCFAALVLSLNACNTDSLSPASTDSVARSSAKDSMHHPKPGSLTAVAVTSLPAAVTSYITANYAGATINEAKKDANGNLFVLIMLANTTKRLRFSADGTFVGESSPKGGHTSGDTTGRPRHTPGDSTHRPKPARGDTTHHRGPLTTIAVTDLPDAVTSYINTNYAGATVKGAGKHVTTGDIFVQITIADNKRVGLVFGADGTFKKAVTVK